MKNVNDPDIHKTARRVPCETCGADTGELCISRETQNRKRSACLSRRVKAAEHGEQEARA